MHIVRLFEGNHHILFVIPLFHFHILLIPVFYSRSLFIFSCQTVTTNFYLLSLRCLIKQYVSLFYIFSQVNLCTPLVKLINNPSNISEFLLNSIISPLNFKTSFAYSLNPLLSYLNSSRPRRIKTAFIVRLSLDNLFFSKVFKLVIY